MKKFLALIPLILFATQAIAVESVESIPEFDKEISKPMVIAHFYYKNDVTDDYYESTTNTFEDVDGYHRFVRFIKINVERDDLSRLKELYNLKQTPTFILFSRGKEIDRLAVDPREITVSYLQEFIYKHFREEIEKLEEQRRQREILREEIRRELWYSNPYYPYGGGYYHPYYPWYGRHPYYYHPYHRGGVHFGVGFRIK